MICDLTDFPLRCDVCGKPIPWRHLEQGSATRKLITPDSDFSREEYETLCIVHNEHPKPPEERNRKR